MGAQAPPNLVQYLVASGVPIKIIDLFEAIHINRHQAKCLIVLARRFNGLRQFNVEASAIWQAG